MSYLTELTHVIARVPFDSLSTKDCIYNMHTAKSHIDYFKILFLGNFFVFQIH